MPDSKSRPLTPIGYPEDFLKVIGQLESSGGKNIQHSPMQSGIQAGTTAIGRYGLMPNTVKEMINRKRMDNTLTPQLQVLDKLSPDQMKAHIESNPNLEDSVAKDLAIHVLQNQGGDENKAAYSWQMGHNLPSQSITPEKMNDPSGAGGQYVNKFKRIKDQLEKTQEEPENENGE